MLEWLKPNLSEIVTYIVVFIILVILIQLFQSMSIKSNVQKTSRCYQLKYRIKTPTNINVKNIDGVPLYNIKYDIAHKNMSLDCACPVGSTVNTFNNIKLYNFATHASEYGHLTCNCDSQYGNDDKNVKSEQDLLIGLKYQEIDRIKNKIYSSTTLTDAENSQFINFLNKITVSFKPSYFDSEKYIQDVIASQGNSLSLTTSSRNNIKQIIDNIVYNVVVGDIDISLKSSIKNNVIQNNPNLSQNELNIVFIILDTLDNSVINRGNNVIEYTINIPIPTDATNIVNKQIMWNQDLSQIYNNKTVKDVIKMIYEDYSVTDNSSNINIVINYQGTILQSENSKDFIYDGNPDIIRYMESDDTNIFERNILSDV